MLRGAVSVLLCVMYLRLHYGGPTKTAVPAGCATCSLGLSAAPLIVDSPE